METFIMIGWPLLIFISYKAAVYALNKAGKL
jgi:hypothetical protein